MHISSTSLGRLIRNAHESYCFSDSLNLEDTEQEGEGRRAYRWSVTWLASATPENYADSGCTPDLLSSAR